ncbi:MAG: hypothetical protein C4297_02695 [Gemmataceae bacterium]
MHRSDLRALVDRGRKAGLKTGELYLALSGRPLSRADLASGARDGNGFICDCDSRGYAVFYPDERARHR